MERVRFYFDGFNLYHAINKNHRHLLWLDLHCLSEQFILGHQKLAGVHYFSAIAWWKEDRQAKHRKYARALSNVDVEIIWGKFKRKSRYCRNCDHRYFGFEEKRTDVALSVRLVEDSFLDKYDTAVIVSGDTDFIPAIETIKRNFPAKRVGVLFPIGRRSTELKQIAHFVTAIKEQHLATCQFPDQLQLPNDYIIEKPRDWV